MGGIDHGLLHRRAEAAVLEALGDWLDVCDPVEESEDGGERARVEGTIAAAEAVGAISTDEAAVWRSELAEAAAEAPSPGPGSGPRHADGQRAELYLTNLVEEMASAKERMEGGDRAGVTDLFERFNNALEALGAVGALTEDEDVWRDRVNAALGRPSQAEQALQQRQYECAQVDLLRVIPGADPVEGVHILWAELYADGVAIHYRREVVRDADLELDADDSELGERALQQRRRDHFWPQLTDDVGTHYFPGGGGSCGRPGGPNILLTEGNYSYAPAPPPEAKLLFVVDGDLKHPISLTGNEVG
jgi:hypothetical protein